MARTKDKAAVAIGLIGIANNVSRAWAAAEEDKARRNRHLPEHMPVIGALVGFAVLAVASASYAYRHDRQFHDDADAFAKQAAKAGTAALQSGAHALAEGRSTVAVGTAAVAGAGKRVVQEKVVDEAKHQLDEKVVQPARKKAIFYGTLAFIALTIWVALISVLVQMSIIGLTD